MFRQKVKTSKEEPELLSELNFAVRAKKSFSARFCEGIISTVLFLIFFLVPIFSLGVTAQGSAFEKFSFFCLLLLLGLIAWMVKGIIVGQIEIKRSFLDWPSAFFLGAIVLSVIFSKNRSASIFGSFGAPVKSVIGVLVLAIFVYFLVNNFNRRRRGLILLGLAFSGLTFLIVFGLLQFFSLASKLKFFAAYNPLGSVGGATIFMAALIPLLLVGILGAKAIWPRSKLVLIYKAVLTIALLGSLIFLFLAGSFVFWPASILGVLILLIFLISRVVKTRQPTISWPIAVFLVLVFFYVVGNIALISFKLPAEVSLSNAFSWQVAENSLKQDLLFGSGLSNFKYDFAKFKPESFNQTGVWNVYFDSARGFVFEVLATTGILGALTLTLLLAGLIFMSVLVLIKAKKNSDKLFLAGGLGALAVFTTSSFVSVFDSTIILLAALLSGLLYAATLNSRGFNFPKIKLSLKASPQNAIVLASVFLFVSAGVVVFFALLARSLVADFYANKATAAGTTQEAVDWTTNAIRLVEYQPVYFARLGQYYMTLVNEEVAKNDGNNFDRVKTLSYLQAAVSASRRSLELSPNDVETVRALAAIYENATLYVGDARNLAEDYYKRMLELEPVNPMPYIRLGYLKFSGVAKDASQEDKEKILAEAIVYYQKALDLKSDLASPLSGMALAYEAMGNYDKAVDNMLKAVQASPNDLGYRVELARVYFNQGLKNGAVVQSEPEQALTSQPDQNNLSLQQTSQKPQYVQMNKELETAQKILINVIANYDNYANAHYLLGLLYEKTRRPEQAKAEYRKAADLLPAGRDKKMLEDKINSI